MRLRQSLEGKFALLTCLLVAAAALCVSLFTHLFASPIGGFSAGLAVALALTVYAVRRFMRPINRLIRSEERRVG